jgi:hypothetical protein
MRDRTHRLGAAGAACGFLALLVAAVGTAGATAPEAFLISPGRGIGPLTVAMRGAQARTVMGAPKATRTDSDGNLWLMWFLGEESAGETQSGGLYAVVGRADEVLRVVARGDPRYATADGLHPGVTEQTVVKAIGQPSSVEPLPRTGHRLVYASRGIWFVVIDNPAVRGYRTVYEIAVFKPE